MGADIFAKAIERGRSEGDVQLFREEAVTNGIVFPHASDHNKLCGILDALKSTAQDFVLNGVEAFGVLKQDVDANKFRVLVRHGLDDLGKIFPAIESLPHIHNHDVVSGDVVFVVAVLSVKEEIHVPFVVDGFD